VPGTSAHSWQPFAAVELDLVEKVLMVAAKPLTKTAIDLFKDKKLVRISGSKIEFWSKEVADLNIFLFYGDMSNLH